MAPVAVKEGSLYHRAQVFVSLRTAGKTREREIARVLTAAMLIESYSWVRRSEARYLM